MRSFGSAYFPEGKDTNSRLIANTHVFQKNMFEAVPGGGGYLEDDT